MTDATNIRLECLKPAKQWVRPTGNEIREVMRYAGLSASKAAEFLGLGDKGGRTVRRWIGEETCISYANWALLCERGGLGMIWKDG